MIPALACIRIGHRIATPELVVSSKQIMISVLEAGDSIDYLKVAIKRLFILPDTAGLTYATKLLDCRPRFISVAAYLL